MAGMKRVECATKRGRVVVVVNEGEHVFGAARTRRGLAVAYGQADTGGKALTLRIAEAYCPDVIPDKYPGAGKPNGDPDATDVNHQPMWFLTSRTAEVSVEFMREIVGA